MKLVSLVAALVVFAVSPLARAQSGCAKDSDCKGSRVCVAGACTSPAAAPAPIPTSYAAPRPDYAQPAPQPAPQYAAPQPPPAQQYAAPQPAPQYAAPQPPPQYAAPQPAPQYAAPQPPPQYAAPQPAPQYAAPQPAPQFVQTQPMPAPQHAAPQPPPAQPVYRQQAAAPAAAPEPMGIGPRKGSMGISFALPSGGAPSIGATFFVADRKALRFDLGLDLGLEPTGFAASLEGGFRIYVKQADRVRAFVQPGVFLSRVSEVVSFAILGGLGVEYMVTEQLALGGATGIAFRIEQDAELIHLTTGTSSLFATFYF